MDFSLYVLGNIPEYDIIAEDIKTSPVTLIKSF